MDIESKLNTLRLEVAEAINIFAMCGDKTPTNQLGEKLCKALNASTPTVPAMPIPKQEPAWAEPYPTSESYERELEEKLAHELTPSPRITEQDAREIAKSAMSAVGYMHFDEWMVRVCPELLNKLNANAVAEVRQEPFGKICKSAECGGVDFYFDKIPDGETMLYAGPQPAQAAAMPEYLSAIEVLRENIRNPDRGVEYCGIFDNDKTRAAIGTLLSASTKPE